MVGRRSHLSATAGARAPQLVRAGLVANSDDVRRGQLGHRHGDHRNCARARYAENATASSILVEPRFYGARYRFARAGDENCRYVDAVAIASLYERPARTLGFPRAVHVDSAHLCRRGTVRSWGHASLVVAGTEAAANITPVLERVYQT